MVLAAVPGAAIDLGSQPTIKKLTLYGLAHGPQMVAGLGRRRILVERISVEVGRPMSIGEAWSSMGRAASEPLRSDHEWSSTLLPSVRVDGDGRLRRQFRDLVRSVAIVGSLADLLPETLLRYAESRGIQGLLEQILDTYGLAPPGSMARLLLKARDTSSLPGTSVIGDAERSPVTMPVVQVDGCCRTVDELAARGRSPLIEIDEATVLGGFLVTARNEVLVLDDTADPRRRGVAGQHDLAICGSRSSTAAVVMSVPTDVSTIERGLLLSNRADANWYHFLVDTLPRMRYLREYPEDVPLLVNGRAPSSAVDLLSRLTSRRVIALHPDRAYEVRRLTAVVGRSSIADTQETIEESRPVFAGESLRWLRRLIANEVTGAPVGSSEVLIVQRRSGVRSVRGQGLFNLIPSLRSAVRMDPLTSDLDTQVEAYRSADVMVVPGGAALANMLFVSPTTTTIGLVARSRPPKTFWRDLAEALESRYVEVPVMVLPSLTSLLPRHHRDAVVTPASVVRLTREISRLRKPVSGWPRWLRSRKGQASLH
jgi:hypothetical protein